MPVLRPTFPSFTRGSSSPLRRDSLTLPDYYRTTRLETYGPYFRSTEPVQDLLKTIDHRGRESIEFESGFLLPDSLDGPELNLTEMEDATQHNDAASIRSKDKSRARNHEKGLSWLAHIIWSTLSKYRARKGDNRS